MLIYSATKREFLRDVKANVIEEKVLDAFKRTLKHGTSKSEIDSWRNSMMYMGNAVDHDEIPDDAGIAIEYNLPQTSKRIDFIISGKTAEKQDTAVIVELKQWTEVSATKKDAIVVTRIGGALREVSHPSYQAWSYAALLEDFNEAVQQDDIELQPCAYLHNCLDGSVINSDHYAYHTKRAPAFLRADAKKLAEFIKKHIRYGDAGSVMYRIDNGKIRPSKALADSLASLLKGNPEFIMIDDQKVVFETALELAEKAQTHGKQVLIVNGGPGTGKSVVAINLLVALTSSKKVSQYVTRNAAPREVYKSRLSGTLRRNRIDNLFRGSGSFVDAEQDAFDTLVVDEAHRLNEKSGMYQNLGENQVKEIIHAAKCSVFFLDEDQRVTLRDIGEAAEIRRWAEMAGAEVTELSLTSQFRCNGSDGYLAWIDQALQIRETANTSMDDIDYDFRVVDSPSDLYTLIAEKNKKANKARLVAGYCWDWESKKDNQAYDISFPEFGFKMQWNLADDGSLWMISPESVEQIGCIHTCQGLELDYIGVIIGPDFKVRNGKVVTDASQRAGADSSVRGYRGLLKSDPDRARELGGRIIKNTYRTLMTRGTKGCFVWATDPETNEWLKGIAGSSQSESTVPFPQIADMPLALVPPKNVKPYQNAVPVYELEVAAGNFGKAQSFPELSDPTQIDIEAFTWVELPDSYRYKPGQFVARVTGESMNRRIPNGAWCLFQVNPYGTRQNKVVVARHADISDPDTGGQYTVKVYESIKVPNEEGGWRHSIVRLKPDTTAAGFRALEFDEDSASDLKVVAELVAVLA